MIRLKMERSEIFDKFAFSVKLCILKNTPLFKFKIEYKTIW